MRHRILTCKNHLHLRWSCKDIAWDVGGYNGLRHIFFNGTPSGKGMFSDGSGLDCTYFKDGKSIIECDCPTTDLILAPEDTLVTETPIVDKGVANGIKTGTNTQNN